MNLSPLSMLIGVAIGFLLSNLDSGQPLSADLMQALAAVGDSPYAIWCVLALVAMGIWAWVTK